MNSARGITGQVAGAVYGLSSNFTTASNPAIVKYYSQGNIEEMTTLMFKSCRISFALLLLAVVPLTFNIDYILTLWLCEVPKYTNVFIQLILIHSLLEAVALPLQYGICATGNII